MKPESEGEARTEVSVAGVGQYLDLFDEDDRTDWNFVMGNDQGDQIDFHVVEFDEDGRGTYGPPENDKSFPASSFTGRGVINGRPVHCLDAEFQIQSHTGYEIDENDVHDVMALHGRFDVEVPSEYPYPEDDKR
ncbi:MAG: nucleotidyltransferase domain-containing protein [Rhodothermia bacterium]